MANDYKDGWSEMLAGSGEKREMLYCFFESQNMRSHFKGEAGIEYYKEIISIARKANAPLDEVRTRLIPLLDKEIFDAYIRKSARETLKSDKFVEALEKLAETKKAEHAEKLKQHEAAMAILEAEKKKASWFKRIFS